MDEAGIRSYIAKTFPNSRMTIASAESGAPEMAWGDTFFFADKDGDNPHTFPFATIVTKDYADFDTVSNLNRPGIFRLNFGLSRETFRSLFSPDLPTSTYDFTALDTLMPHPVYGPQFFACIINPSHEAFHDRIAPLLAEAYQVARKRSGID